jgi:predicted phage tail component-like protein
LSSFIFDDITAEQYFDKVISITRPSSPSIDLDTIKIKGKVGTYLFDKNVNEYVVEVRCLVSGEGDDLEEKFQNLWSKIREINRWLLTDEPKKLILTDEPDLYYMAIVTGEITVEEILEHGFLTISFYCPDGYAFGETVNQRLASIGLSFERDGVRYRNDGSEVTPNFPVYGAGLLNQAVLIEEGTTNLLPSSDNPTTENFTFTIGDDYYLSYIGDSVDIKHSKTHSITQTQLEKEGTDLTRFDTDEEDFDGTFSQLGFVDDHIEVLGAGTDFDTVQDTTKLSPLEPDNDSQFDNSEASANGVIYEWGGLKLDVPTWDMYDNMSDYSINWSLLSGASPLSISQGADSVTITQNNTSNDAGIYNLYAWGPITGAFRARGSGTVHFVVADGATICSVPIPIDSNWAWYYVRINEDFDEAHLYKNGVSQSISITIDETSNDYVAFILPESTTSELEIDQVYLIKGDDLGAPPSNGIYTGTYTSKPFSLNDVGVARWSYFAYGDEIHTSDGSANITLEYQLGEDDGNGGIIWDAGWTTHEGEDIEVIELGQDLTDTYIRYRFIFTTSDPGGELRLWWASFGVSSGYYSSGSYTSDPISLSSVGKAADTEISWNETLNGGTVAVEVAFSNDSYSNWYPCTNGGSIPNISQSTDLSSLSMRYRVTLNSIIYQTPEVSDIEMYLKSGYKASQTFNLGFTDFLGTDKTRDSLITFSKTEPAGTSVLVEYSLDGIDWYPCTSGQPFLPSPQEWLLGLNFRYTLSTTDTNFTPTIGNSLTWSVTQSEPNKIKIFTGNLTLVPNQIDRWQLEKKTYGTGWQKYGTAREPEILKMPAYNLNSENKGTIEFWAKIGSDSREKVLACSDSTNKPFHIKQLSNNNIELKLDGQTWNDITGIDSNDWHYFVLTWDGAEMTFYLDGVQKKSNTYGSLISFGDLGNLIFGCDTNKTKHINSYIDEIVIHDNPVDSEYAEDYYNEPVEHEITTDTLIFHLDNNLNSSGDANITVRGSAPTFPTITVEFADEVNYFNITNGVDHIQIDRTFEVGDVLMIDCERNLVTVNGSVSAGMSYLSLDSDFFEIKTGQQLTATPQGSGEVTVNYVERWK